MSWLQSIPFHVNRDDELLAVIMLGNTMAKSRFGNDAATRELYEVYFHCYQRFIGDNDDWDLVTVGRLCPTNCGLI